MLKQLEAIYQRLDPIVEAIRGTPARTLAGAGIKARAVAAIMPELSEQREAELETDKHLMRDLIENICSIAGVDLPRIGTADNDNAGAVKLN